MTDPEMRLMGDENGSVAIVCQRKGCLVPGPCWDGLCFLEIELPYDATPADVDRLWHEHRIAHASLPA